jgi:hypothetical protein
MRNNAMLSVALALFLFGGGSALAQATIEITPEQEASVYAVITKEKLPTPPSADVKVSIGAVLPETVELYEVPTTVEVPEVRKYRYTVVKEHVVLVDPTSRKVVKIIRSK